MLRHAMSLAPLARMQDAEEEARVSADARRADACAPRAPGEPARLTLGNFFSELVVRRPALSPACAPVHGRLVHLTSLASPVLSRSCGSRYRLGSAREGRESATSSDCLPCRQVVLASRETWKYLVMCLARAQLPSRMPGRAPACVTTHDRPETCLLALQRS